MGKNGLLTVSQFSKLIKQTPQAVYKQFNNKLKDYVVTVDGKKMVKPEAVRLYEVETDSKQVDEPTEESLTTVNKLIEMLQEELKNKESVINSLTKQLEIKDKQIDDYSKRLQEAHSLHLVDKKDDVLQIMDNKDQTQKKESLLTKIFPFFKA